MAQRFGIGVAVLFLVGGTASAQQSGQVQVSYDVEFYTTGALMSAPGTCGSASGTDKLTGTITGWEPAQNDDDITYKGRLTRVTDVTSCSVARRPNTDQDYHCSVSIKGKASVPVEFDLYYDKRGGYLRAQDTAVTVIQSSVTGNCDQAEMAQWQSEYFRMNTAGSPDGQPINVPALPRGGFPVTFAPSPAQGGDRGIWTLIVRARRP